MLYESVLPTSDTGNGTTFGRSRRRQMRRQEISDSLVRTLLLGALACIVCVLYFSAIGKGTLPSTPVPPLHIVVRDSPGPVTGNSAPLPPVQGTEPELVVDLEAETKKGADSRSSQQEAQQPLVFLPPPARPGRP